MRDQKMLNPQRKERDPALGWLMDVYVALGKWYRDAFLIERELDLFRKVEIQTPIVGCVYPHAHRKVHRTIGQLRHHDQWCRFGQGSGILGGETGED